MDSATGRQRGPVLLCYDGSDNARQAIERAGQLLGGGEAVVLTVWRACRCRMSRGTPHRHSHRVDPLREAHCPSYLPA